MFIDFFYLLRSSKIPVSTTEWLTFMEALKGGMTGESLMGFYAVCRGICVKSESHYDSYDQCFAYYFKGIKPNEELAEKFLDWLKTAKIPDKIEQQKAQLKKWDFDKMREEFEKRLKEQKERHDGGSHYVGTGGTSPFGNSGYHPDGIRVGGESRNLSASQIASKRQFKNLRHDRILDTRTIGLALKKLRHLGKDGALSELNIEDTIKKTADNGGELSLSFEAQRKNTLKIVLLMDVGGSMTSYAQLCEQLFSAAHASNHFKAFSYYYFHNCPYDYLFSDIATGETIPTKEVLRKLDPSWNLIVIGDAAMNPYELTAVGGSIDYFFHNKEPGLLWLKRIKDALPKSIWLNPEPEKFWHIQSNMLIRRVFSDMYPLTVDGLSSAIEYLNKRQKLSFS